VAGYLVDHHSPDPPLQPLDNLDVDEWEDALKRAHVNCMLTYCKDHYGATYYDTHVGRKHPGLKMDWIAEVAEMMRRTTSSSGRTTASASTSGRPTIIPTGG